MGRDPEPALSCNAFFARRPGRSLTATSSRLLGVGATLTASSAPAVESSSRPGRTEVFSFHADPHSISSPHESEHEKWFASEVMPHEPILRAYLRKRFPQLTTEVDDVVQETFLKTIRARAEGKLHSARGFLFTAAHNLASDFFRRRQRIAPLEQTLADTQTLTLENPSPADSSVHAQELELLKEAIERLPFRCRQVIKLRKIYGLSHREIAAQLGISERTVTVHVGMGLRRCAAYFRAKSEAFPRGEEGV